LYRQLLLIPLKNIFNGIILGQVQAYQVYAQKIFIDYLLSCKDQENSQSPGGSTRDDLDVERTKLISMGEEFLEQETKHNQLIADSQACFIKLSKNLQKIILSASVQLRKSLQSEGIAIEDDKAQKAIRSGLIMSSDLDEETIAAGSSFWEKIDEQLGCSLTTQQQQHLVDVMRGFIDLQQQVLSKQAEYSDQVNDIKSSFKNFRSAFYQSILRATDLINFLPDYKVDIAQTEENRSSLHFDSNIGGDSTN
jgi:hypothetical protein